MEENQSWVIAFGDPFDGIQLVGPFDSHEAAVEYAEDESGSSTDWWIAPLEQPFAGQVR